MNGEAPRLGWVPPFLVGASAAMAAEVAAAILLYDGVGLLRSLTTILAVEAGAFAAGLWNAPREGGDLVERLRVRWLVCLSAFLAAAAFGTAWSMTSWLGDARWAQGLGLALVGGVPLYTAGTVLSGLGVAATTDPGRRLRPPGPAAAAGVAAGVMLAGFLLPRAPLPASLLVACLVLLSLGGMVLGTVLGARTEVRVLATRPGRSGVVRVEDRSLPRDGYAVRRLLEGEFVRRELPRPDPEDASGRTTRAPRTSRSGEATLTPWDVGLVREVLLKSSSARAPEPPGTARPKRLLHVGGGASPVARSVLREDPVATVDVIERTASVIEVGRDYFDTDLTVGDDGRISVRVGNLDDALGAVSGAYDLVLVDTPALAPSGGVTGLSVHAMKRLTESVAVGGVLAWGPLPMEPGRPEVPAGWISSELRRALPDGFEHVIVIRRGGEVEGPAEVEGFDPVPEPGVAS